MKKIICILLLILTSCVKYVEVPVAAHGGDSSSGGGNGVVAEFLVLSNRSLGVIARQGDINFDGANAQNTYHRMHATIQKMQIQVVDAELSLRGKPVTAINYPLQSLIRVSQPSWSLMFAEEKLLLVLHEVLALTFDKTEVDDTEFYYSRKILEKNVAGDYPSSGEMPNKRNERKVNMRDAAHKAVVRHALQVEGITNYERHHWGPAIINNIVHPVDVDVDISVAAEDNLKNGTYRNEPYSLVQVRIYAGKMERDYMVRLFPDNSVVDLRFTGEH